MMMMQNPMMGMGGMMPGMGMGGMNPMMGGMLPNVMSAQAQFHQPAEKNQIKLFVGGLAFQTTEGELAQFFTSFGKVENTIVMRDKATGRGRGFGFVLLSLTDEQ
jgi:RNA recognition motif-containing protein